MAKIENSKKGREDGGYTRLFGNKQLGALISQVHAASISAGNELETLVQSNSCVIEEQQLADLFKGNLDEGTFLIPKSILKKRVTDQIGLRDKKIEPDFLLLVVSETICYVVELKDGDSFDTKKSEGEVTNLKTYAEALGRKLPYPWIVHWRVCMFNQCDKEAIVRGFKNRIERAQAMTGEEFCCLLGISYDALTRKRVADQEPNLTYFVHQLLGIPEVREVVTDILNTASSP